LLNISLLEATDATTVCCTVSTFKNIPKKWWMVQIVQIEKMKSLFKIFSLVGVNLLHLC
jgi:hypothetical protein